MAQSQTGSLIGSIVERKPGQLASAPSLHSNPGNTGFPAVQHRSKSAFARARGNQKRLNDASRHQDVPKIALTQSESASPEKDRNAINNPDDWRQQTEEENRRRVENMTEEEREEERREILARFGPGIGEILKKARAARETQVQEADQLKSPVHRSSTPLKSAMASRPSSPPPALSTSSTRPPSQTDKHIRFADVKPQDVYVYESAPPSPRRKPLALVSPTEHTGPTISLGEWKGKLRNSISKAGEATLLPSEGPDPLPLIQHMNAGNELKTQTNIDSSLEEGTPEDIRRRFFPGVAPHDPSLAWIEGAESDAEQRNSEAVDPSLRFDLAGNVIPPSISSTLPTHLGLHHHAEGEHAGYTLDDIFLLSRSTVPAQRASMMNILSRIARKLAKGRKSPEEGIKELSGQEASLRKRILAAGVEAMNERGSLAVHAVEAMWVCTVHWDEDLASVEGIELKSSSDDTISSLPLNFILPLISDVFKAGHLPQESLVQLLAILNRIAQESNECADKVVATPNMVSNMFQRFLLTPIPPLDDSILPEPLALQVLITFISASRTNASTIVEPSETLLRFVVSLPSSSPFPPSLATSLLSSTFRVYTCLASYGLGAQLATTAAEHLNKISQYVLSEECTSKYLREAWLGLVHAWLICARDPHRTTPSHDILWSQVIGWGWGDEIMELSPKIPPEHTETWSAIWAAEAAWLEGVSINGVRGGQEEKYKAREELRPRFESGVEMIVVENAVLGLGAFLDSLSPQDTSNPQIWSAPGKCAYTVASALRLWLSCIPSHSDAPLYGPPFSLPLPQISSICARLVSHPLWFLALSPGAPSYMHALLRPFSLLLSQYLGVSRMMPDVSEDLWMAQAFSVIARLLLGDEEMAVRAIESSVSLIRPVFVESRGWHVPPVVWERKAMESILPFLTYSPCHAEVRTGPLWMSPMSIAGVTTQRLPPFIATNVRSEGLPLGKDWMFAPLNYLLRSGQSDVFKSLPSDWDASETELVRATLLLARLSREVLTLHGLHAFLLSREETVFACMKVFMLEHGDQQVTTVEEVFRDTIVEQFIDGLIAPFTIEASPKADSSSLGDEPTLEIVAKRFLGESTPFYQYYIDFVALYDSISFSHPTFARFLLPPLSMRYPIDYRKFLWVDHGHVVRTIQTPVGAVIAANIGEFLWPVETNAEMLGAYLRTLTNGHASGFLRFVAVHHVACNIWPDLGVAEIGEKSMKLLQAIANQGSVDAVRDVITYSQTRDKVVSPPGCFDLPSGLKTARVAVIEGYNSALLERLGGLLM